MATVCSDFFGQGFRLSKGQEFTKCPYNKYHRVNRMKFTSHLLKCRQNHRVKQLKKRGTVIMMSCKYNHNHKVYTPELQYHESVCLDRLSRLPPYLLVSKKVIEKELGVNLTVEMFQNILNNEINANKAGIYTGPPGGGNVLKSQLKQMTAKQEREVEPELDNTTVAGATCLFQNLKKKGGKKNQVSEHLKPYVGEAFGTPDKDEEDSDEDWGTSGNGSTFSFMRGARNTTQPQIMHPPGSSKSGRVLFQGTNSKLLAKSKKGALKDVRRKQLDN